MNAVIKMSNVGGQADALTRYLSMLAGDPTGYPTLADTYTTLAAFPGPTNTYAGGWGVSSNGKFYYVGGEQNSNAWSYDMTTNTWSSALSWVGNLYYTWGTGDNGVGTKIWLPNVGYGGGNASTLYAYETSNNTYTTYASSPEAGRRGRSASDKSNLVYMVPGYTSAPSTNFYRYNISGNSWSTLTSVPASQYDCTFAYFNTGKVYLNNGNGNSNFYEYSISGNSWTQKTQLASALAGNAQQVGNYLYVLGNSGAVMSIYDPATNTWIVRTTTNSNVQSQVAAAATNGTSLFIFRTDTQVTLRYG